MPDLNLGPPPSRSPLPSILIAACILIAVAAAVVYFNPHKTAEFTITRVQLFTAHTETKAMKSDMDKHIMGAAVDKQQDLYVVLNVKLTDKLRLPLFIKDETAVLTAPDHSITETSALQKSELASIFQTFPELKSLASEPLARDAQIAPGQTSEGTIILHFPQASEKDWTTRQSATLTLSFFHQSPQTLTIP